MCTTLPKLIERGLKAAAACHSPECSTPAAAITPGRPSTSGTHCPSCHSTPTHIELHNVAPVGHQVRRHPVLLRPDLQLLLRLESQPVWVLLHAPAAVHRQFLRRGRGRRRAGVHRACADRPPPTVHQLHPSCTLLATPRLSNALSRTASDACDLEQACNAPRRGGCRGIT